MAGTTSAWRGFDDCAAVKHFQGFLLNLNKVAFAVSVCVLTFIVFLSFSCRFHSNVF